MKLLFTTKEMSRVIDGYLETSLNLLPSFSCFFTLGSSDHSKRISGSSMLTIAKRSIPGPNAQPFHLDESTPNFSRTLPFTTQLPKTSNHLPPPAGGFVSISICSDGSVYGNVSGKILSLASGPNTARAMPRSAFSKSSNPITFLFLGAKYQPSI